ncbi:ABC transporter substrate-binding protein [Roseiarcaceae bacterium H3SJ34-1]|uniref:ABC transporter substrate-binding protein n=1 Tax=Terripilifer ovatus TaxID=3032367 RepID=UPI003AB9426F|nr:ABC transporter substrate-binding protein [Roseiarcaceae bacterium H3SJ34-1]
MKKMGLAFGVLLAATASSVRAEDVVTLAIGQKGAFENNVAPLGQEKGFFKKHGIELKIFYTQGSGETIQAVISGSADIGVSAGTLGTVGAFAKGAPVRIIGATIHGANDLYWYVKPDSPIKSMRDTAGKTVSYSTAGSSTNTAVLAFRDYFKVDLKPTATGGPQSSYTQTLTGQVDVGWSGGSILLEQMDEGKARVIARASEVPQLQNQTPRVLVSNVQTVEKRREVLQRFMAAYRETREWIYSDPAAIEAFAKWAEIPVKVANQVRTSIYPKQDLDPDKIIGMDLIMEDVVKFKYATAALTKEQISQLFLVPFK